MRYLSGLTLDLAAQLVSAHSPCRRRSSASEDSSGGRELISPPLPAVAVARGGCSRCLCTDYGPCSDGRVMQQLHHDQRLRCCWYCPFRRRAQVDQQLRQQTAQAMRRWREGRCCSAGVAAQSTWLLTPMSQMRSSFPRLLSMESVISFSQPALPVGMWHIVRCMRSTSVSTHRL
jgi:hypothetical protein